MDMKVLLGTAVMVFLAEVGDKTQLAVIGGTASTKRPVEILIGASLGLVAATAVGVLIGSAASQFISPKVLRMAGGVLFLAVGLWLLLKPAA